MFAARSHRYHSVGCVGTSEVLVAHTQGPAKLTSAEIVAVDDRYAVVHARITVDVRDVDVVDDGGVVVAATVAVVPAPAPPAVHWLERRQRHPADSTPTESGSGIEPAPAIPTHPTDHRGAPVVPCAVPGAWVPAPASAVVEPAPVVVRRPTPGIVTDPSPAVVIGPSPAAVAVRRPIRRNVWPPHVAVRRRVDPIALSVQILSAIDVPAHVLVDLLALA